MDFFTHIYPQYVYGNVHLITIQFPPLGATAGKKTKIHQKRASPKLVEKILSHCVSVND